MIITCKKCSTSFNLDDSLVKDTGSKVRCSVCKDIFTAFPQGMAPVEDLSVEPEPIPQEETGEAPAFDEGLDDDFSLEEAGDDTDDELDFNIDDKDLSLEDTSLSLDEEEPEEEAIEPLDVEEDDTFEMEESSLELEEPSVEMEPEPEETGSMELEESSLELEDFEEDSGDDDLGLEPPALEMEDDSPEEDPGLELEMESSDEEDSSLDLELDGDDFSFDDDGDDDGVTPLPEEEDDDDELSFEDDGLTLEEQEDDAFDDLEFEEESSLTLESDEGDQEEASTLEMDESPEDVAALEESTDEESSLEMEEEDDDGLTFEIEEDDEEEGELSFETDDDDITPLPDSDDDEEEFELEFDVEDEEEPAPALGMVESDDISGEDEEPEADTGQSVGPPPIITPDEMPDSLEEELEDSEEEFEPEAETIEEDDDEDLTLGQERSDAVPPIPTPGKPEPKKSKAGCLVLILLLLILLVAGAYVANIMTGLNIPYLSDIKIPAIENLLKQAKPAAQKPAGPLTRIAQDLTNGSFEMNADAGRLFVITGEIENISGKMLNHIKVKGILSTKSKPQAKVKEVFCGNIIPADILKKGSMEEIDKMLARRNGEANANVNIKPGAKLKFMIVFSKLPDDLKNYSVKAL